MATNMDLLFSDAVAAGYIVERYRGTDLLIIKRVGRWKKPVGLIVYEDGTAFDLSVDDLSVAKCLRSCTKMRFVLGI